MPQQTARATLEATVLHRRFREVRSATRRLCRPLATEDFVAQSMPDVSPTKWHLAHVTWFFETFVLRSHSSDYRPAHPAFEYLFNSYYHSVGEQYPRPERGLLTRPTVDEIFDYREHVDDHMSRLLERGELSERLLGVIELGLHHEQQHQELMLMDIKHVFSCNPLYPSYREPADEPLLTPHRPVDWVEFPGGLRSIGADREQFSFDNEGPRHEVHVRPFLLGSRLITNGEFLEFIEDGGYRQPILWLADGWTQARDEGWQAPLYWRRVAGEWREFTLEGLCPLRLDAPVCHLSLFEASAYAAWAGARLPAEAEWEVVAAEHEVRGNLLETESFGPRAASPDEAASPPLQLYGDVWEWTATPYGPYPGYHPVEGALGEYNAKFMCNQYVMRGGSFATPRSHIRATYRNFFYPHCRWQFGGLRLARDAA